MWPPPALTDVYVPAGTFVWPYSFWPQQKTPPLYWTAHVWPGPALSTWKSICPGAPETFPEVLSPQQAMLPS